MLSTQSIFYYFDKTLALKMHSNTFVRGSGLRSWLKPSSENQIKFDWFINDTFIHMSQPIKHFPITRVSFVPRTSLYGCVSEQGNDHSAQMGIELHLHFTCVGNGEESSAWTRQIQLLSQISLVYGQSRMSRWTEIWTTQTRKLQTF